MIVTARSARRSASLFSWGSIIAVLLPFPLLAFWFGASIFIYTLNRNHPEPKVLKYTQRAANRFYLMCGVVIVLGKFIPRDNHTLLWFFLLWLLAVLTVMMPSIRDLYRIHHDQWVDIDTSLIKNPDAEETDTPDSAS
ncbi:MAG: hypothetical protein R3E89_07680 [Thiolinea sp.]